MTTNTWTGPGGIAWTFFDATPEGLTFTMLGKSEQRTLRELARYYGELWPVARAWWQEQTGVRVCECGRVHQ